MSNKQVTDESIMRFYRRLIIGTAIGAALVLAADLTLLYFYLKIISHV